MYTTQLAQFGVPELESLRDATNSISQDPNQTPPTNLLLKAEFISSLINTLIIAITIVKFIMPAVKTIDKLTKSSYSFLTKSYFKEVKYVEDILENILLLTEADRVCVGVFHNGDKWGSFHFMKMSIIYEAKRPGIQSFKKTFQSVPIERLIEEIKSVSEGYFSLFNKSDSLSVGCQQHMDANGISAISSRLISKNQDKESDRVIAVINCHKITGSFDQELFEQPEVVREFNRLCWALTRINESKSLPDLS